MSRKRILLLVAFLAGSVAGLLLATGITRTRNAANRTNCVNNLRSLAVGIANYESANDGALPRAVLRGGDLPPEHSLSWLFELDPFIHARMDPEWRLYRAEPWNSENNLRLARQRMLWVGCPGAPSLQSPDGYFLSHYVGATGVGTDAADLPLSDPRAGVFGYERKTKDRDVKDGSEVTIAIIETGRDNGPWMAGGRPTSRSLEEDDRPAIGVDRQFGGFHTGGANVAFLNGSVRFIRTSIDPRTLAALFTIAGGESDHDIPE